MGSRIATTTIDADFRRPICSKGRKAGVQIVVRLKFSIGNVVACRHMNGARNMAGAWFGRIAGIGRPRPRIQQSGLLREIRSLFGINSRHTSCCQNDISGRGSARGDMV